MKRKTNVSIKTIFSYFYKGVENYKALTITCFFLYLFSYVADSVVPYFYKDFFDTMNLADEKFILAPQLVKIILIIAFFHFMNWILFRFGSIIVNITESRGMIKMQQMAFNYLIDHSHNFFANNFTGSLVQRVNRLSRSFEKIMDMLYFQLLQLLVIIVSAVWITYYTSKIISLIILGWVAFYTIGGLIFYRWRLKFDSERASSESETSGLLADNISNFQTIALFCTAEKEKQSYRETSNNLSRIITKTWNWSAIYDGFQFGMISVIEFIVFYYAIKFWEADKLTAGGFVMIQIYVISLGKQLWTVNRVIRDIFESIADAEEGVDMMETPHEIQDIPVAKKLNVTGGKIEFKNVVFNFNETRTVLDDINCEIKAGEKIALVGPSGAGKTTFVRLLLRLYNLTQGHILIDDQDIQKVTQESLRKNISLVPQDPVLFHRTLMENIRYGRQDATDEEVIAAAKLAHCDEFIEVLPDKYQTYVGERGVKLSGGERQRVAIARAILKKAPILILDEATSSLDSNSEALIQDALDRLMDNCTTIAIAHRLSTISKMDRIIVIDGGKIVEEGTHTELSHKEGGLYHKLWTLQAGGFIRE
jgi:ATP-binding cassette subfamily B protein